MARAKRKSNEVFLLNPSIQSSLDNMKLPSEKTGVSDRIQDYSWMFYGAKRIGKTSFVSQFKDILILATEPVQRGLSIYKIDSPTYRHFLKAIDLVKQKKSKFKMVAIDTADRLYKQSMKYAGELYGFNHPGEANDYGASWDKVRQEFESSQLDMLLSLNIGFIVIAHEKVKTTTSISGFEYDTIIPALSNAADEFYRCFIDNVCRYHIYKGKRWLQIRPSDYVYAGVACKDTHFLTKGGESIVNIPMGDSAEQAYKHFVRAWNNEQKRAYDFDKKEKRKG